MKPRSKLGRRIGITILLSILLGALLAPFNLTLPESRLEFYAVLVGAIVLSVVVHELGHVLATWLTGSRLLILGLGPLQFQQTPTGLRISLVRPHIAGFIVPDPVTGNALRSRLFLIVAGGPFASLALTAVGVFFVTPTDDYRWAVLAACSGIILFFSLAPGESPLVTPDGVRMWVLLRGGASADRFSALLRLTAQLVRGVRPRDWPADAVAIAATVPPDSADALTGLSMHYHWLFDCNRIEEAAEPLDRITRLNLPAEQHDSWHLEAAWFAARFRRDAETARSLMQSVTSNSAVVRTARRKAEAAIAYLEGRLNDADAAASEVLEAHRRLPDNGLKQAAIEEVEALLADIRST